MTAPIPGPRRPAPAPVSEVEALMASRRHDLKCLTIARAEVKELRASIWRLRESRRALREENAQLTQQLADARKDQP